MRSMSIRLKVKPEKQAEFEGLVIQLMKDVYAHMDPPVFYEVRRVRNDPLSYLYFISFKDDAAYDTYADAPWHQAMSPKAIACLDGDPEFEDLDMLGGMDP